MKQLFTDIGTAIMWAFGLIMLGRVLFQGYQVVNVILLVLGAICFIFGSVLVYLRLKSLPGEMDFDTDDEILEVLDNYRCNQD